MKLHLKHLDVRLLNEPYNAAATLNPLQVCGPKPWCETLQCVSCLSVFCICRNACREMGRFSGQRRRWHPDHTRPLFRARPSARAVRLRPGSRRLLDDVDGSPQQEGGPALCLRDVGAAHGDLLVRSCQVASRSLATSHVAAPLCVAAHRSQHIATCSTALQDAVRSLLHVAN